MVVGCVDILQISLCNELVFQNTADEHCGDGGVVALSELFYCGGEGVNYVRLWLKLPRKPVPLDLTI